MVSKDVLVPTKDAWRLSPFLKTVLAAAFIFLIFLIFFMEFRAAKELSKARNFRETGAVLTAARHYFQALNWYSPWGASQRAADELMDLGLENLKAGRKYEAYVCFLRLRGALIAARSFYLPRRAELEKINSLISLYLAESKLGPGATIEEIKNQAIIYHRLYSSSPDFSQGWYFVAISGFFIWVGAASRVLISFYGPKRTLGWPERLLKARLALLAFIVGYVLWVLGMALA